MKTRDEIIRNWETEGYYTDWYEIDSYNPLDGIERCLFVGTRDDAVRMMRDYYAQPTDLAMQPFYRCSLISPDEAYAFFTDELKLER